jgi:predicted Zn-ribbon and HTH transcriptional regulator
MKCSKCGSEFRITMVKGKFYCFECEADASLEAVGLIRPIKERRTA